MSDFPRQGYQPEMPKGLPECGPPPAPPRGGSGLTGIKHLEHPERPPAGEPDRIYVRYVGDCILYLADVLRGRHG